MDTSTLRGLILRQLETLGITVGHAARLAGLPDQTVRDYLVAGRDLATGRVLALAAAVGLVVTAAPLRGYQPETAPSRGRPLKNNPEKS